METLANLSSFCKSIAGNSCVAKEVLFNIAWDRFGITFGLARLAAVIHIIWTIAIQGHVWTPAVIPRFKLVTQFS